MVETGHVTPVLTSDWCRTTWPSAGVPAAPLATPSGAAAASLGTRSVLPAAPTLTARYTIQFQTKFREDFTITEKAPAPSAPITAPHNHTIPCVRRLARMTAPSAGARPPTSATRCRAADTSASETTSAGELGLAEAGHVTTCSPLIGPAPARSATAGTTAARTRAAAARAERTPTARPSTTARRYPI